MSSLLENLSLATLLGNAFQIGIWISLGLFLISIASLWFYRKLNLPAQTFEEDLQTPVTEARDSTHLPAESSNSEDKNLVSESTTDTESIVDAKKTSISKLEEKLEEINRSIKKQNETILGFEGKFQQFQETIGEKFHSQNHVDEPENRSTQLVRSEKTMDILLLQDEAKNNQVVETIASQLKGKIERLFQEIKQSAVSNQAPSKQQSELCELLEKHRLSISDEATKMVQNKQSDLLRELKLTMQDWSDEKRESLGKLFIEECCQHWFQKNESQLKSKFESLQTTYESVKSEIRSQSERLVKVQTDNWINDKEQFRLFLIKYCNEPIIEQCSNQIKRQMDDESARQINLFESQFRNLGDSYELRISEAIDVHQNVKEATKILKSVETRESGVIEQAALLERRQNELDRKEHLYHESFAELDVEKQRLSELLRQNEQVEARLNKLQAIHDPSKIPELIRAHGVENEIQSLQISPSERSLLIGDIQFFQSRLDSVRSDACIRNLRELQFSVYELGKSVLRLANQNGNGKLKPEVWQQSASRLISEWFKIYLPVPGQPFNSKYMDDVKPGAVQKVNSWAVMPLDTSGEISPLAAQVE